MGLLLLRKGGYMVGNHHRAQVSQFEFFELIFLWKSDRRFPVEQFEAAVSQSTVPSPPLNNPLEPENIFYEGGNRAPA